MRELRHFRPSSIFLLDPTSSPNQSSTQPSCRLESQLRDLRRRAASGGLPHAHCGRRASNSRAPSVPPAKTCLAQLAPLAERMPALPLLPSAPDPGQPPAGQKEAKPQTTAKSAARTSTLSPSFWLPYLSVFARLSPRRRSCKNAGRRALLEAAPDPHHYRLLCVGCVSCRRP